MQDDGSIAMVGIVQEQHPERAQLFMQWKQLDWPIMVDAQNELGVAVVPITIFIDEHGIIRNMRPPRRGIADAAASFAGQAFDAPEAPVAVPAAPDLEAVREATTAGTAAAWRAYGTAIADWAQPKEAGAAIEAFSSALDLEPDDGPTHFRLGVAFRRRAEGLFAQPGDFQRAVNHWCMALFIDPNQYIWRRRIQQYGPRLDKPYSFYDWVTQARADITARGETPVALPIEPSGAEFAHPEPVFGSGEVVPDAPDLHARIRRDDLIIMTETTVVPAMAKPGDAVRVHLVFYPNADLHAHWNNEAEPMQVWVHPPEGWRIDRQSHTVPNAATAVSLETRRVEFEVRIPDDAEPARVRLPAYALYNVCEGAGGKCLYRRRDATTEIRVIAAE